MLPEHQMKVDELITSITATLRIECHNLYNSGAIEVNDFNPDEYVLAKTLITAAMHKLANNFEPPPCTQSSKEFSDNVKNLILT